MDCEIEKMILQIENKHRMLVKLEEYQKRRCLLNEINCSKNCYCKIKYNKV